jgi:hypothetical protein
VRPAVGHRYGHGVVAASLGDVARGTRGHLQRSSDTSSL